MKMTIVLAKTLSDSVSLSWGDVKYTEIELPEEYQGYKVIGARYGGKNDYDSVIKEDK